MNRIVWLILVLLITGRTNAENERPRKQARQGRLTINFSNHTRKYSHADSVLVIFDKYNLTGAGIIKKVYYPSSNHSIEITEIPPGKYYVFVQFLGIHSDRKEKILRLQAKKKKSIRIRLMNCDEFD